MKREWSFLYSILIPDPTQNLPSIIKIHSVALVIQDVQDLSVIGREDK